MIPPPELPQTLPPLSQAHFGGLANIGASILSPAEEFGGPVSSLSCVRHDSKLITTSTTNNFSRGRQISDERSREITARWRSVQQAVRNLRELKQSERTLIGVLPLEQAESRVASLYRAEDQRRAEERAPEEKRRDDERNRPAEEALWAKRREEALQAAKRQDNEQRKAKMVMNI